MSALDMDNFETGDETIHAPLKVAGLAEASWYRIADVVVVGFGGAGVSAALEARDAGAEVIALDRFSGGGATRFSGGIIYAGGGTAIQREAGVVDSVEEMTKYLRMEVGEATSTETVHRYCEQSSGMIDWLMRQGVHYDSSFYKEKIVYPPDGYYLYYSGNEKVPEYAEHAAPAARGHRPVSIGFSGYAMYDAMQKTAIEKGVELLRHSPVTRLVQDGSGRIIGVEANLLPASTHARHAKLYNKVNPTTPFNAATAARSARASIALEKAEGRKVLIGARRGVILCTGGFSHNMSMLRENVPFLAANLRALMRMNSLGCNGAGIRLGVSAGGATKGLSRVYLGRNMSPPAAFLHGVMVNARGERFVNECAYNSIIGRAILEQPGGEARLIMTSRDFWQAVRECLFSGWNVFRFFGAPATLNMCFGGTRSAKTLEALAHKCGMDPAQLQRSVARYNETLTGGDDFGKRPENKIEVSDSRYFAINFSIPNKFAFSQIFTVGGLQVNEHTGEVLRAEGTTIAGLYAAGRTAYGLCSNNYVSGLSIGDCVFTGRRAAAHCMKDETAHYTKQARA
jgi:3-oxo-5alpha-steroid 4-dehydrogenase